MACERIIRRGRLLAMVETPVPTTGARQVLATRPVCSPVQCWQQPTACWCVRAERAEAPQTSADAPPQRWRRRGCGPSTVRTGLQVALEIAMARTHEYDVRGPDAWSAQTRAVRLRGTPMAEGAIRPRRRSPRKTKRQESRRAPAALERRQKRLGLALARASCLSRVVCFSILSTGGSQTTLTHIPRFSVVRPTYIYAPPARHLKFVVTTSPWTAALIVPRHDVNAAHRQARHTPDNHPTPRSSELTQKYVFLML